MRRDGRGKPAGQVTRVLALDLTPSAESISGARDALRGLGLPPRTIADAVLLVSELVTNAVRHGALEDGDSICVQAEREDDLLRVEVRDPGPGWHGSAGQRQEEGGLGLVVVDALARRWGTERAAGETRVWFELDTR